MAIISSALGPRQPFQKWSALIWGDLAGTLFESVVAERTLKGPLFTVYTNLNVVDVTIVT